MSAIATLSTPGAAVLDGALPAALFALLSGGVVGMSIKNVFDSILSDDGEEVVDDEMADGGGLMGEEGDDDFGDLGGFDDDEMDAFGGDEFDDVEEAGADPDELQHRLDELESEVGSLSSTVNTVRTENEKISESVEDVEENVRKLLDIYEMVTRGVNPFADDVNAGMGGGGGMGQDSSFGLFDDDGGGQEDAAVDEDIANADPEGFFDEDLAEEDGDDDVAAGSVDDVFDDAEPAADDEDLESGSVDEVFDDDAADLEDEDGDGEEDDGDGDGGKSFQELKDEYEEGDAEWAGEGEAPGDDPAADEADGEDAVADDASDGETEPEADEPAPEVPEEPETVEADPEPVEAHPDPAGTGDAGGRAEATPDARPDADASRSGSAAGRGADDAGKPYLAELPSGFAGDLLVVEWLEYLCSQGGYRATARAIDYYESIDWIDRRVADELHDVLRGFDDVDGGGDGDGGLTIDHHRQSLSYISQLDGDGGQSVALSRIVGGGGPDGLQR